MLSILTPTYNRAYILPQLFESLKRQSKKGFEWIVVDDGSTDNTEEIVRKWKDSEIEFNINYIKQDNGGKHRAINKGINFAQYDFTYILDSDDYLTNNAVELIYKWIKEIDNAERYVGVSGCKGKYDGNQLIRIGDFPDENKYVDSNNIDRIKNKLQGDKAEIYRTEILKKYPFPEFEGEKFLWEAVVWNKIASDGFLIRWFPEIICICDYLHDGLTNTDSEYRKLSNFNGYTLLEKMNCNTLPFPYNFFSAGRYYKIAKQKKFKSQKILEALDIEKSFLCLGIFMNFVKEFVKTRMTSKGGSKT
ncbi:Glycosyl transferase family 2 [Acetoanaerobium noterae]|uniref:Glycosyl transferase family 2 n=1 Tax=Acetoanaerobium noterae TaxID=745369 RepID=A0A1T5AZH8_9FIRM|nr:glycosyltransferase family A protein [Acetoanaerobium noterae]SKB40374.1 Glycosyl transferase family 2 [Acetoanaerobium noterae]